MTEQKVGVQLHPQHTTIAEIRAAWEAAEALGVDSIWTWDHFYPLYPYPHADNGHLGDHFEGWSLLAAMAVTTTTPSIGMLVSCNSYRNPELLADMARTCDHLSGGRFYLGVGGGWFEKDYDEYGYEFGTAGSRLRALGEALPRIRVRLGALSPAPVGDLPILVGGSGEKVTLRLVAEHADAWNTFGPAEHYRAKSEILDRHCADVGRDPADIERTIAVQAHETDRVEAYAEAGATHQIVMLGHPFDLAPVEDAMARLKG